MMIGQLRYFWNAETNVILYSHIHKHNILLSNEINFEEISRIEFLEMKKSAKFYEYSERMYKRAVAKSGITAKEG